MDLVAERSDDRSNSLLVSLDNFWRLDRQFRLVDEENVVVTIVIETCIERQTQHIFAEAHWFCPEDARIHLARMTHNRFEIHPVEDVAFDVDTRGNLDQ